MSDELLDLKPSRPISKSKSSLPYRVLLSVAILFGGVFAFISTQILAAVIAGVVLSGFFGLESTTVQRLFDNNLVVLAVYIFSAVLLLGLLALLCLFFRKNFLKLVGLAEKPRINGLAWAFLAYSVYFVTFAILATIFLPLFKEVIDLEQQQDLGVDLNISALNIITLFVMFVVIPPIIEEILFRGFIYRSIRKLLPFWPTALLVSVVFGAMHLELLSGNAPNWIAMIDTGFLSLVLVVLVEKTNSLWSAIYVHALKNFVAFSLLLAGVGM